MIPITISMEMIRRRKKFGAFTSVVDRFRISSRIYVPVNIVPPLPAGINLVTADPPVSLMRVAVGLDLYFTFLGFNSIVTSFF